MKFSEVYAHVTSKLTKAPISPLGEWHELQKMLFDAHAVGLKCKEHHAGDVTDTCLALLAEDISSNAMKIRANPKNKLNTDKGQAHNPDLKNYEETLMEIIGGSRSSNVGTIRNLHIFIENGSIVKPQNHVTTEAIVVSAPNI